MLAGNAGGSLLPTLPTYGPRAFPKAGVSGRAGPGRDACRLPGAAACGVTGYGVMAIGRAEAISGRGRPDGRHSMALILIGRLLMLSSPRCPVSGSSCGEAGVRVKTVPPTATARLRSILRVSQKVDTSIGPLLNGQTEDIPRSSRLTTYPGWARWGP